MSDIAGIAGITGITPAFAGQTARPADDLAVAERFSALLDEANRTQQTADAASLDFLSGGDTELHELMAATTQAELALTLTTQVRDRALEMYRTIMDLQL